MRLIGTFLFICLHCSLFCQIEPLDTLFYGNGDIHKVKYLRGERESYPTIRYFKSSKNILDKNEPFVDTMFDNTYHNKPKWSHYQGRTRRFLHKQSHVYITKSTKYGSLFDSIFYKIGGSYAFLFKELEDLQVIVGYNNDSTVNRLTIAIYDSINKYKSFKELFSSSRYDNQRGAKFSESYQTFQCGDYGTLELFFRENNLLHSFNFHPKDSTLYNTYYELYEDFHCKHYGKVKGNVKVGKWYGYHPNGNISTLASYKMFDSSISSNMYKQDENERLFYIREGLWRYFNEKGVLIKEEKYLDGKLLK